MEKLCAMIIFFFFNVYSLYFIIQYFTKRSSFIQLQDILSYIANEKKNNLN
jgi:hypothetical protein